MNVIDDFKEWSAVLGMSWTDKQMEGLLSRPWVSNIKDIIGPQNFDGSIMNIAENLSHKVVIKNIERLDSKVLDYGAGNGCNLFALEEQGYINLWYYDRSVISNRFFKWRCNKHESKINILNREPTEDDRFDKVYQVGLSACEYQTEGFEYPLGIKP